MITPSFAVRQDDDHVYLDLRVPHVRIGSAEFVIDGDEVHFFCAPYFLRLTLPGQVLDNEAAVARYDADDGTLAVTLPKAVPGETFPNLDMLTTLLQPKQRREGQVFFFFFFFFFFCRE